MPSLTPAPMSGRRATGFGVKTLASLALIGLLAACGRSDEAPAPTDTPAAIEPTETAPSLADAASEDAEEAARQLAAEEGAFAHEASDISVDPNVRYGRLENGLRYAILVNDTPSDTAALRLRVDMGSLNESEEQRGLAHFIEHMAFNGSTNIPEDELVAMLERFGLAFGPDTNAYTSFDETVYQLNLPATDDETVDVALFILREMGGEALFAPEAVDRERGVVLSEERVRNTFGLRYLEARNRFLFPEALVSERLPIGLVEVLETAPAERLRALYEAYYTPERSFLVAVGDFAPLAMEAKIRETFSDWAPSAAPGADPDLGVIPQRATEAGFFSDPDMYTVTGLYVVKPPVVEPDTVANRQDTLMQFIGEAIVERRLQRLARYPDAKFLQGSVTIDNVFGTDTADFASIELISEPQDWRSALEIGEQELRRALEHGFTEGEVREQVANIRTALENAADQADTRESTALADGLVNAFASQQVFTHPDYDLGSFEAVAPSITPDATHAAFMAAWADAEPVLFVSNNTPIPDAETEILSVFEASRTQPVAPPANAENLEFAYTDFGEPGRVAERTVDNAEIVGPFTRVVFENGVRLTVKTTDYEDDVARVSMRVGGGLLEFPKGLEGLQFLYNNAFTAGGLEAHSTDELQSILAGRTVGLSVGASADAFTFTGATTPDDLLLQLQVFAAFLTAPGFREEGETQYRQLFNIVYDTFDSRPASVRDRDAPRILRSGDPRYGIPAKDALLARSFEELRLVTARAFGEGAIEIGVVGDVEADAVIDAVARTFGALAARRTSPVAFEEARIVRFPNGPQRVDLTHAGEPNQAEANVYWPTVDDSDVMEVRRLNLLQRVFDLKLIERVREQDGATYSPQAASITSRVNPGYGYLTVSLAVTPEEVDPFFAVVDEIAAELAAGAISEDELTRARRPLLEDIENSLESNSFWLRLMATAQTQPRYVAQIAGRTNAYEAITTADLTEIAATYLRPDQAVRIAILPERAAATP